MLADATLALLAEAATTTRPELTPLEAAAVLDGAAGRVYLLAGQALPGPDTSARGRVIWQYDTSQDGAPPGHA